MRIANFAAICQQFNPNLTVWAVTTITETGEVKRLPLIRVGHHPTRPEHQLHEAVEVFTPPWLDGEWETHPDATPPLTVGQLASELAGFVAEGDLRVAVPTDQGHHRILSIQGIGFRGDDPSELALDVEPWDHGQHIIRADEPANDAAAAA